MFIGLWKGAVSAIRTFFYHLPSDAQLVDIICKYNGDYGPFPGTGGVIHRIPEVQAYRVAEMILQVAKSTGQKPSFIAGWLACESLFDPGAFNPNHQDGKPGETPQQTFMHTDWGLCQLDGSILGELLPGLTWEQQRDKALDLAWAGPQFAQKVQELMDWATNYIKAHPEQYKLLGYHVRILAIQAYNSGQHGAENILNAEKDFDAGDWKYANAVLSKAALFQKILGD